MVAIAEATQSQSVSSGTQESRGHRNWRPSTGRSLQKQHQPTNQGSDRERHRGKRIFRRLLYNKKRNRFSSPFTRFTILAKLRGTRYFRSALRFWVTGLRGCTKGLESTNIYVTLTVAVILSIFFLSVRF